MSDRIPRYVSRYSRPGPDLCAPGSDRCRTPRQRRRASAMRIATTCFAVLLLWALAARGLLHAGPPSMTKLSVCSRRLISNELRQLEHSLVACHLPPCTSPVAAWSSYASESTRACWSGTQTSSRATTTSSRCPQPATTTIATSMQLRSWISCGGPDTAAAAGDVLVPALLAAGSRALARRTPAVRNPVRHPWRSTQRQTVLFAARHAGAPAARA